MAKTLKHIAVLAEDGHRFLTELKIRKNFTFKAEFSPGFVNAMTYSFDDLKDNGGKSNMTIENIECIANLVDGSIVIVEMEAEFKDVDGNAIEIIEMRINNKAVVGVSYAYDGCHKLYICETESDELRLRELGYEIHPIETIESSWHKSCEQRFIHNADLTKTYVLQGQEALFEY